MKDFQWATALTTIIRFGASRTASALMYYHRPDSITWNIGTWLTKRSTSDRRAMNAEKAWKRNTEKIGENVSISKYRYENIGTNRV